MQLGTDLATFAFNVDGVLIQVSSRLASQYPQPVAAMQAHREISFPTRRYYGEEYGEPIIRLV